MKESDLYAPVKQWLQAQGYQIHVELFDADVVAVKDGLITVVELKPCLTYELTNQLSNRASWADFVIGCVGSEPRNLAFVRSQGFGLLQWDGKKIRVRAKPKQQPYHWHKRRAYRAKVLLNRNPAGDHELAGLPSCPQLKQQRRMREVCRK